MFFIDVHSGQKPGDGQPAYEMWQYGPIVTDTEELFAWLPQWQEIAAKYRAEQQRLLAYTADALDPRMASERGADAIAEYLGHKSV